MKQSELYDAIAEALGVTAPPASPQTGNGSTSQTAVAGQPLRILLAEDSLANQKLAIGLLTKWGHHVMLATNGREAVTKATSNERFDLVLMDVQMPEMDGFEATRTIREYEDATLRPRLPIVAMTAHAMKGDRDRCLAAGMDGYVSKPVRASELSHTISQIARRFRHLRMYSCSQTNGIVETTSRERPSASQRSDPRPRDHDWTASPWNMWAAIASCCKRSHQPRSRNGPSCWINCANRSIATIAPPRDDWPTHSRTPFALSAHRTLTRLGGGIGEPRG